MMAGVLAGMIFIGTVGFINFFSKGKQRRKEERDTEEEYKRSLLCRFVLDGVGKKVGESVAVDEDILIIKTGKKYLGVPLKHIEEEGKTLLVKGLVDKRYATMMGEKWQRESFKEISYEDDG
jgi:hypothetical protein